MTKDCCLRPRECFGIKVQTSSNLPLRRASTTSFFRHQTSAIRLNSSGACTWSRPRFRKIKNGRYASQRGGGAMLVPHIRARCTERRVPYQPQASSARRCDSIQPFLPDARVLSSVAGGAHTLPISSSGAAIDHVTRESARQHATPFGTRGSVPLLDV